MVIHVDDVLYVGKYNQIQEYFKEKLQQQIKCAVGEVCTDHLGLSVSYSNKGFFLNQRTEMQSKELQITKSAKSMDIHFNALKLHNELLEDKSKSLRPIRCLNYLSLSSRPDVMCVSSILSYTLKNLQSLHGKLSQSFCLPFRD